MTQFKQMNGHRIVNFIGKIKNQGVFREWISGKNSYNALLTSGAEILVRMCDHYMLVFVDGREYDSYAYCATDD